MLTFLRRLPDDSVSVWASGIDSHIITREESRRVSREIERVLHPSGALICTEGTMLPLYWKSRVHALNPERRTYPTRSEGQMNTYRTVYEYVKREGSRGSPA